MEYQPQTLAKKYRELWNQLGIYSPDLLAAKKPYYNLMMFPYPSAEGLHVGNMYAFTGADVHGRFRRMQGFDVFEPIGLDGFGIHSENYAIKVGRHPVEQAKVSEEHFYEQLQMIGNGYAWNNRLETYDPQYYRWTQWLFAELFRRGLAYRAEASVNWCPSCKTVLADEQVEDGRCERCKTVVVRRNMTSWYLKITEYADRLLDNIDSYEWTDVHGQKHVGLDWPKKVTIAQKNWIGRSEGLSVDFSLPTSTGEHKLTVWTKFWETVFGVTYLVLAPEHPLVEELTTPEQQVAVSAYVEQALNRSEQDRQAAREKTGVFTGSYAVNPVNGEHVPIWVADYVLSGVGSGAVMGVPAHDARDFDFAKKHDLPIRQVVAYADPELNAKVASAETSFEGEGTLTNSRQFDGQEAWGAGKEAMKQWLIEQGYAQLTTNYHLRDWLISRQRYWGPPIPLVYCPTCADQKQGDRSELPGWYAVPDSQLPVELPYLDNFKPEGDGTSPLDNASDDWKFTVCPHCGGRAERETDVSDTFLDSSWYFLRYPVTDDQQAPFALAKQGQWFPVDAYIGGAEHAVLHLLYSRFITMALKDWGMLPSEEPFPYLFGHGLIIKDGAKMSKSKGNVVNPDEYIKKYGADALRAYLMFLGPYDQGGDFRDTGMHAMYKWLDRVWKQVQTVQAGDTTPAELEQRLHQVILANTADIAQLKYNTCLARLMEFLNSWKEGASLSVLDAQVFIQLLAPFAPYLTEALYTHLRALAGENEFASVHTSSWPVADPEKAKAQEVEIAVQVNGKLRDTFRVRADRAADREYLEAQAKERETVQRHLANLTVRKVVVVPGKIVNFVG